MLSIAIQILIAATLVYLLIQLKKLLKEIKKQLLEIGKTLYLLNANSESLGDIDKRVAAEIEKTVWKLTLTGIKIK